MLPWARGRILAASVLVECYRLPSVDASAPCTQHASPTRWLKKYEEAFAGAMCDVPPIDRCSVMMRSLDPAIVDCAIQMAKCKHAHFTDSDLARLTLRAAVRSGQLWILDRARQAWSMYLWALHSMGELVGVSVEMFDRILDIVPDFPIFEITDLDQDLAHHIAEVFCGRVDRPWSAQWSRDNPEDREYDLMTLVEGDNDVLLNALDSVGLYDLPDTIAVETLCNRRSIKTAAWLIGRARQKADQSALDDMMEKMLCGAIMRSRNSDGFPCSSHPEALLSWLLGGPTPYDPLAPGARVSLAQLFEWASRPDFACEVPHCLLWMCLRWPAQASMHVDAIRDGARQMLTRNNDWIGNYLCRDGTTLEYLVYMLDAIHAALARTGHATKAEMLLRNVDLYTSIIECTRVVGTQTAFIQHGRARCADDDSVPTRLALIRAFVLRGIDPRGVDPWRATFASVAAWRRWFRAPPTD